MKILGRMLPTVGRTDGSSQVLDVGQAYVDHGQFVARVIQQLAGPGSHVEDLLHETFVIAHRKAAGFDPGRGALTSWLYAIARNVVRQHRRSLTRRDAAMDRFSHEPSVAGTTPEHQAQAQSMGVLLRQCLDSLPWKQREVFVLFELEQLSGAEISQLIGVPEGTVRRRLFDARRSFQRAARVRRIPWEGVEA